MQGSTRLEIMIIKLVRDGWSRNFHPAVVNSGLASNSVIKSRSIKTVSLVAIATSG